MINRLSSSALRATGSREAKAGIFSSATSNRRGLTVSEEKLVPDCEELSLAGAKCPSHVMSMQPCTRLVTVMGEGGSYPQSPGKVTHFKLVCFVSFVDLHVFLPSCTLAAVNDLHQYQRAVGGASVIQEPKVFSSFLWGIHIWVIYLGVSGGRGVLLLSSASKSCSRLNMLFMPELWKPGVTAEQLHQICSVQTGPGWYLLPLCTKGTSPDTHGLGRDSLERVLFAQRTESWDTLSPLVNLKMVNNDAHWHPVISAVKSLERCWLCTSWRFGSCIQAARQSQYGNWKSVFGGWQLF